jgi:hypothetical protein
MRLIVASNPLTEEAIKNKRIDRSLADMDALPPHSNAISSLDEEHPLRMFRTALLLLAITALALLLLWLARDVYIALSTPTGIF